MRTVAPHNGASPAPAKRGDGNEPVRDGRSLPKRAIPVSDSPPPANPDAGPAPGPSSTPPAPAPVPGAAPSATNPLRVIVRPLPKVVFFYLTWLAALVCALLPGEPGAVRGLVFMGVFFFNCLAISFDFNEERSVIFLLLFVAAIFGLLYFDILGSVGSWLTQLQPVMNRTFYWMFGAGFSFIYLFVWLNTRFNYWEFRPNEVVHRYGIFPKMKRYSTEDMRWEKSIPDILERILLGTGTITLTTPHERQPMVLDHVMGIGRIDDQIANILGVKAVVQREVS